MAKKSKKSSIALVVIVIIAAVLAAILIPLYSRQQRGTREPTASLTSMTSTESSSRTRPVIPNAAVSGSKAPELAKQSHPDYDFELESAEQDPDGKSYYILEGVDSHGNVLDVKVDAQTGEVIAE
ncbi:MAG: hypothetical protein U0K37_00790 [Acutalibacteraceae bacterium]|nr:hypothetical protein [Acutalibacteraceae bacterium]